MTINKFKVFTWDRVLLYLLPPTLLIVALVAAVVHGTTPLIGYVILSIVTLAWFAMSSVLFTDRYKFQQSIKSYTKMGTGILLGYVTQPSLEQVTNDVSAAETEVVNFWCSKLQKPISTFMNYINGGMISFTKQVIDLTQHAPTGPLITGPGFKRWAVGSTSGNWSCVEYSGELSDWERAMRCYRHEAGHKCLNAAGYDDPTIDQHKMMKDNGFQY